MRIAGLMGLEEFAKEHADARGQLNAWVLEVQRAVWRSPSDVKARFPTASFLGDNRVIFNIKGNNYRIDTKVSYETQLVLIKRLGTHAEYSKWEF